CIYYKCLETLTLFYVQGSMHNYKAFIIYFTLLTFKCYYSDSAYISPTDSTFISPKELQLIEQTLKWPAPPTSVTAVNQSTSPYTSSYIFQNPRTSYSVGDIISVVITARDGLNNSKVYGGDFFQAKLFNTELKASVYGEVVDHLNGTYTANFKLLWAGQATVAIRLIHSSEAVEEKVVCNAQRSERLLKASHCCCEYRHPITGESWICRRPNHLPCMNVTCVPGLDTPSPAGFYLHDNWTSLMCHTQSFHTIKQTVACLKDKQVLMMGDSTLRQWYEYLLKTVPSMSYMQNITEKAMLKKILIHSLDTANNIRLVWRAHGLPIRTSLTPRADLHYIASEVDALAGGQHSVVVFTIWAHFTTFPLATYLQRLAGIRRSVLALLQRAPQTLVLIKSANTGYKDIYGSDWLSWQLDCALRVMFRELPVVIIDVWQMTSCHYLPDDIHPSYKVIKNEVDLFLSFVCPR
uniref:NXPE C-terminal domain-containing protein n=1 Tax=Pygocentrus nattereri TaxID=42514 RepID=A0AAR2IJ00_PYGNA